MKIKRYMAASMRAALGQVRAEQGPDAVILSSRRVDEGIEVIAAVDYDEALFVDATRLRARREALGDTSATAARRPPSCDAAPAAPSCAGEPRTPRRPAAAPIAGALVAAAAATLPRRAPSARRLCAERCPGGRQFLGDAAGN